jgi:WhiB family redox-sensing transcriptional regulator
MILLEVQPWYDQAACLDGVDADAFFPDRGGSTRTARRVCASCPVKTDCLDYALANDERFGVWGGLSERERRRLKRRAS